MEKSCHGFNEMVSLFINENPMFLKGHFSRMGSKKIIVANNLPKILNF